jgi:hypothetical protein
MPLCSTLSAARAKEIKFNNEGQGQTYQLLRGHLGCLLLVKPRTTLVRPSRDGDQFHYLWAARRCLLLLSAQSDLVAISIEGFSQQERVGESPARAGEEVIDIAEYFGSEEIKNARLVRYMQLKHSTVRAIEPWTASGLEKTITGFAKRFRELRENFSADALGSKLEFWFVTNRPIATDFAEAVADAATGASPRHPDELQKLERFTDLRGNALREFFKLLHFQDRQDDYWDQRNILFQEVGGYLPDADVDAPLNLKELVTRRALSEGETNPTITKMDVLRALHTEENFLFPAPCLVNRLDTALSRAQEPALIQEIIGSTNAVIVHASAGVGKTVFATRIADGLPIGSTCILYDCFGNAQYRNASGYRHRHKDALVQIANELAAKGLCHLLIPTSRADASAYMRAFVYRIGQAATQVQLANPNALLCIVVDAADNAQMAAEEIGESRSFVRDLIRERMPKNVRLIFICRSHRQDYLDPPVEALRLELKPFSRQETARYLRQRFPDASKHDVDEFHRLSSHNPRVQALALSRNNTLPETLRLLGPNPTTVEDTIGSLLEDAITKLKDSVGPIEKTQIDKICAGLAALRPLIPIRILSKISGVDEEAIKSFAIDLGRPLLVAGDTIQFFDEPAETWFREKFKPSANKMAEFIASLTPLAATSAYVASALPQLMLEAGKFLELVELALTSAALPETSPLEKRDVELQRLQFALKAALRSKLYLNAAKLALKAGGETAGNDRQRKILQANTDLASMFLETDLIQEIVSRRTFGSGWLGSHNAYEAALLSGRPPLLADARSRLRMAYQWLQNWSRLFPKEREDEEISDQDIVELTLGHINIHGPADGARSLESWRPRDISFRVGRIVTRRLIEHGRFQDVEEFARAGGNNLCLLLAVTVELREVQRTPSAEVTRRAFRLVANTRVKLKDSHAWDDRESALNAVTALVEASLQNAVCSGDEAAAVLSRYLPSEPPRSLSSRFTKSRFPLLRAYCLRAVLQNQVLELRDLAHPELRAEMDKKNQHSTSRDLREFQEEIGALLPWYQLWAATLLGRITKTSLDHELKRTRQASDEAAKTYYRDDFHTSNEIALMWVDILHRLDAADATTLANFSQWKDGLKRPLFTPTLTALARLCAEKDATKPAALGFALEAFNLTKGERSDAESKSEGFIAAARAILPVSKSEAKAYFNEAVEVTSKIGDENLLRWEAILDLTDRAARTDRASPEMAYHFARCAELTYDYVDRDKHFDWRATIEALCDLCPSSSLAILSRWRDRGFGWSERILPIAVNRLLESGSLDARDALALICFRARWTYHQLLDGVLAMSASPGEKEATTAYLYRYAQFGGGDFPKLKEVASRHGVTIPGLDEVIDLEKKEKDHSSRKADYEQVDESAKSPSKPARDWDDVFAGCDLANADGLVRAYAAFRSTESPWNHDEFFKETIQRVPIGSEADFIEAVGNTAEFDLYDFRRFLEQAPEEWKVRPAIRNTLTATLKVFCRRYCMEVRKSRHYEVLPFKRACLLAGISEADIARVVLDAVGETPDLADSNRLFSLISLIAVMLSQDEAAEALKFGLNLFTPALEERDGDGPWSNALVPPSDMKASLAGYIWASMAAPEGVLRWEGSHAVLGLAALKRDDVLSHLVKFASKKDGGAFVDAKLPFYYLHALQWFLIGIARAATDFPAVLAPFSDQIVDWALKNQPHVLIRQFAARAALALVDHGVLADRDNLKDRLVRVNITPLPMVESKSYDRIRPKKKDISTREDRYYYFHLDIGPYWYAPLGHVFALSQNEIETEALKVIRREFGSTTEGRWDEDERSKRNLYEENHTYHSHGSYPRADTLHFYYSYHAMMIVAGNLLASTPMHRDSAYDEEDSFADWLHRHDLSRKDGRWLSDRRDPIPLERPAWRNRRKDDDARHVITIDDFDEALYAGNMLNIWGHWTTADSEREQSAYVRSAFVSRDNSVALLRALSTAKNVHDYAIPSEKSDMEIDESGFVLKGWIVDDSRDRELDRQDRWAGGISFPPPMPARSVLELMRLETDLDRRLWRDEEKSTVMVSQVWGHYDEAKHHESSDPRRGSRLQASLGFLTCMLCKIGRDLLIEVQLERRRRYRPYESGVEDDKERIPTKARVYLLGADGRFRTV